MTVRILIGDCREKLRDLPDESVHCCVTSPPYFGLRNYGVDGQMGLEPTPDEFVAGMVEVFREVRRVLRDDGTVWINIGDSFAAHGRMVNDAPATKDLAAANARQKNGPSVGRIKGYKPKDLIGIPWMLAFALRADGWYLRSDIVWAKPNGMPESVQDRPTRSHEFVFLLSKSRRYFYNSDAMRTPAPATETRLAQDVGAQTGSYRANGGAKANGPMKAVGRTADKQRGHSRRHQGFNERWDAMERAEQLAGGSNLRSVWWLSPAQFADAHFATMPESLAEICVTGGSPHGGTVLDPFGGAGTTGLVADRLQRDAILIELNPEYAEIARQRISSEAGMFAEVLAS
jgi:DNA modification methylase